MPQIRAIATKRIQPRRVTRSRECSDLPFEVLLLPEELLLLWQLRVPRRIGTAASLACDLRDLSIDSLQVVFESLQLARSGWRRSRRWRFDRHGLGRDNRRCLGGMASRRLAGGAAFVIDPLSIGLAAVLNLRGLTSPGTR